MLKITEIFYSIQGESTHAGRPCVFVRLTFCNLRCTYCDTEYSFTGGEDMAYEEIMSKIAGYGCNLVEITGGEPLMQKGSLELMRMLCDNGREVLLETGGSLPIKDIDKRVKIIMDLKCPSSGMAKKNLYDNINYLKPIDEVKFVIGTRDDYEWSKNKISEYKLDEKCVILFSPVFGALDLKDFAGWILEDKLNVRMQLQMHKYIWDPMERGV
ncbi:MAG TPA: 7-carboxy-7-deazaguanine synthase QueE [Ignavibacteriales bacterium]|nr:7-carboxy-7-deazaguanine synthase QueE [Ignavibacteriales bacterium]